MSAARNNAHHRLMELLHEGYEALESLDYEGAAKRGREVAARGETAGFELIAQARMAQGRGEDALEAMQEAELSDPSNWGILNRLGSICSDLGHSASAEDAFRRAIALEGADKDAIGINLAILCWRMGRYDDALQWCDSVVAAAWRVPVREVRVGVLSASGRWQEVMDATDAIVEELESSEPSGTNRDSHARLCALRGRAVLQVSGRHEAAIAYARIALALIPTCSEALDLLREARAERSEQARRFHVIVRGTWHEPIEPGGRVPGFLRTYHVDADDAQEAVRYALDIEPISRSMQAEKVRDDGAAEPGCKGVTSCSGYMFQPS